MPLAVVIFHSEFNICLAGSQGLLVSSPDSFSDGGNVFEVYPFEHLLDLFHEGIHEQVVQLKEISVSNFLSIGLFPQGSET